jgi:hypothetical protein
MARVDRAARVAKGSEGRAIMSPAQMGLLFHPTTPASSAASISKDATKAAAPPRLTAPVSPTPNAKTLTEYDAVALGTGQLTPVGSLRPGSRQRPRQPAFQRGSHLRGRVSGSDGCFERALVAGCAEDCGEGDEATRPVATIGYF